ncbi:preprotein translocase subunit YajC [Francisellaceae bacterium]|nr:preprotein translocase subunit YajC [Francisellaceae bacterium]
MNKLFAVIAISLATIGSAFAEGEPAGAMGGGYSSIIMLVAFIAIFYFLMIRPQMKRSKEHKKMLSSVEKGDEVSTNGGVIGKIASVGDNFIELTVSDAVNIKIQKSAISGVLPKGTVKIN